MRRLNVFLLFLLLPAAMVHGAPAKIIKVLPHFLDKEARHTLAPSLYERDAYQAHLRKTASERGGLRFEVQWKASGTNGLRLRVELRGSADKAPSTSVLEMGVLPGKVFSKWSSLSLRDAEYQKFGELIAWRVTLWDGNQQVAEQKSFLW